LGCWSQSQTLIVAYRAAAEAANLKEIHVLGSADEAVLVVWVDV
jgi:hypothetical protein